MKDKDHLKNKLGLDRMNDTEKKKLFNKFVESGGKVVEEKRKREGSFDRKKQKEWVKKIKEKRGALGEDTSYMMYDSEQEIKSFEKKVKKKNISLFNRFMIYTKGLYNHTISLSGRKVNENFFKFLKIKMMPNLKNFDAIISYILSAGEQNLNEIKMTLEDKSSYYYTLLVKYSEFFNESEFNSLLYFYNKKKYNKVTPKHLEEPLKAVFRKIYLLRGFIAGSLTTLRTALYITAKHKRWDKIIYQRRLNQVKYTLNLVFYHLFPKLYSLLLFILEENVHLASKKIIHYLGIKDSDKVDYYSQTESKIQDTLPIISPHIKKELMKEEIPFISKYFYELTDDDFTHLELDEIIIKGFHLMKEVHFKEIFDDQKELLPLDSCNEDDKVLYMFIYLKEFEKEYSFILTSYKIIIKPLFEDNKRVDYKAKLNDLYTPLNGLYELSRNYFENVKSLVEVNEDKLMNQYDKYNRNTAFEGKRSKLAFELRKAILEYFGQLNQYFAKFINDYNESRNIIENPDDMLSFDKEVEGEKKVEGKKIIDALVDAHAYISAFIYRLEEGGDLSGIKPEVLPFDVPDIKKEEEPEQGKEETPASQEDVSFLDEIDETLRNS